MTAFAPSVWIDGVRWPESGDDTNPALAGLVFTYEAADTDKDPASRVTVRLLQRSTAPPEVDLAVTLHVYAGDQLLHAGRIQSVAATITSRYSLPGQDVHSILHTITSVDETKDPLATWPGTLSNWPEEDHPARMTRFRRLVAIGSPLGDGTGPATVSAIGSLLSRAAATGTKIGDLWRDHLRGLDLRADVQQYNDGPGWPIRRALIMVERSLSYAVDQLAVTEAGAWDISAGLSTWATGDPHTQVEIPAHLIGVGRMEWSRQRGDLTTDVPLTTTTAAGEDITHPMPATPRSDAAIARFGRAGDPVKTGFAETGFTSADHERLAAMRLPVTEADGVTPAGTPWRCETLPLLDATDDLLQVIFDPQRRGLTTVLQTGHVHNQPSATLSRVRGRVSGYVATWSAGAWKIDLTVEPNSDRASANWWTPARVAASADPGISKATCASVGPALTFADFAGIGAPDPTRTTP